MLMIFVFAFGYQIFPARATPSIEPDDPGYILALLYHMALPVITIVLIGFGAWAYLVRNFMVGIMQEDFISAKGTTASYVPGKYRVKVASKSKGLHEHLYISEEEEYVTRYNFSTPIAIVTTADEPGGGEAAGGGIFDQAKGVYTNPILTVPFTDKTVIPSLQNIGGAIRGLFN